MGKTAGERLVNLALGRVPEGFDLPTGGSVRRSEGIFLGLLFAAGLAYPVVARYGFFASVDNPYIGPAMRALPFAMAAVGLTGGAVLIAFAIRYGEPGPIRLCRPKNEPNQEDSDPH